MLNEMIEFPGGLYGLALNLEETEVGCVLLGAGEDIKEGDEVRTTGRLLQVPVGKSLLGRVVNALGQPIGERVGRSGPAQVTCQAGTVGEDVQQRGTLRVGMSIP